MRRESRFRDAEDNRKNAIRYILLHELGHVFAAGHFSGDFAEAFATYVHTVLMKKPYAIELYRAGELVRTNRACWDEARCAEKRAILERLLGVQP